MEEVNHQNEEEKEIKKILPKYQSVISPVIPKSTTAEEIRGSNIAIDGDRLPTPEKKPLAPLPGDERPAATSTPKADVKVEKIKIEEKEAVDQEVIHSVPYVAETIEVTSEGDKEPSAIKDRHHIETEPVSPPYVSTSDGYLDIPANTTLPPLPPVTQYHITNNNENFDRPGYTYIPNISIPEVPDAESSENDRELPAYTSTIQYHHSGGYLHRDSYPVPEHSSATHSPLPYQGENTDLPHIHLTSSSSSQMSHIHMTQAMEDLEATKNLLKIQGIDKEEDDEDRPTVKEEPDTLNSSVPLSGINSIGSSTNIMPTYTELETAPLPPITYPISVSQYPQSSSTSQGYSSYDHNIYYGYPNGPLKSENSSTGPYSKMDSYYHLEKQSSLSPQYESNIPYPSGLSAFPPIGKILEGSSNPSMWHNSVEYGSGSYGNYGSSQMLSGLVQEATGDMRVSPGSSHLTSSHGSGSTTPNSGAQYSGPQSSWGSSTSYDNLNTSNMLTKIVSGKKMKRLR